MSSSAIKRLLRHTDRAGLADNDHADLAGILHLVLDLLGDVVGKDRGLSIGDLLRLNHHVELAAGLHRVGALDALVRVRDLLKLLEALDVVLGGLATGTGSSGRDCICGLDKNIEHGVGIDVGMVSLYSVHDFGTLAVATGKVGSDNGVRTLDLVVDGLAEVVKKTSALRGSLVEAELRGHDRTESGNLNRVGKNVLAEGGAVAQRAKGLDKLGMQVVDAGVECGLLAGLTDALVDEGLSLLV